MTWNKNHVDNFLKSFTSIISDNSERAINLSNIRDTLRGLAKPETDPKSIFKLNQMHQLVKNRSINP